jgi:uncharacterized FlgJ-related protein
LNWSEVYYDSDLISRKAVEDNNLTGMMHPAVRLNVSVESVRGFASYRSWQECILDYALYCSSQMGNNLSESAYYDYLEK